MKIDLNEIKNFKKFSQQGLSRTTIYVGLYNNQEVIIKMQNDTSTFSNERMDQALKVLNLNLHNIVNLIGTGETKDHRRFLVLEKLNGFPSSLSEPELQNILNTILITARKLFLRNIPWVVRPVYMGHVGMSKDGIVKLLDFNDDRLESTNFTGYLKEIEMELFFKNFCKIYNIENYIDYYNNAITSLIKEEFASLENVHQPIYFRPYTEFLSRETETNSPDFGKLQIPGRKCTDRAKILDSLLNNNYGTKQTCLDIGCNMGWFCFYLNEKGLLPTGLDFDWPGTNRPLEWQNGTSGKLDLTKFVRDLHNLNINFITADFNLDYIKQMPSYDIVLAFSVLHLYFNQHHYSLEKWIELFKELCKKINHTLIYEIAYIGQTFNLNNNDFAHKVKEWGKFTSVEFASIKSKRPILICKK